MRGGLSIFVFSSAFDRSSSFRDAADPTAMPAVTVDSPAPGAPLSPRADPAPSSVVTRTLGARECDGSRAFCADSPTDRAGAFARRMNVSAASWDRRRRLGWMSVRETSGRAPPVPRDRCRHAHAPATPGDFLFHIRAQRMDLCSSWRRRSCWRSAIPYRRGEVTASLFDAALTFSFVDGTEIPTVRRGRRRADQCRGSDFPALAMSWCRNISRSSAWNTLRRQRGAHHRPTTRLDIELDIREADQRPCRADDHRRERQGDEILAITCRSARSRRGA